MTITPIHNRAGNITHFIAIKQDITELQQALSELKVKGEELAVMTQQLWQASKLATVGELAASVAHELNNPLATISLRLETLAMQLAEDEQKLRAVDIVAGEVERMGKLVSNLLQFSRRSHQQISTIDVREEIDNSLELIEYHLRSNNLQVEREYAEDLPTIQADRQQLRQVFLNLLTNPGDAMKNGGKITIRVSLAPDEDEAQHVHIESVDSGSGIPAAYLEKIWDPFFTTKAEGKGTGLGLAICRRAVEEHRGTISIDSLVALIMTGQGTIQTAVDAMKVGAFDYVLKPFRLQSVMPVLTRAPNTRRLRLENLQLRETVAIFELSQTIAFTLDPQPILSKLADAALQQTDADEVSILLPADDGQDLYVAAVRGENRQRLLGERVSLEESISGWVARQREPLILDGEVNDERFRPLWPHPEIRSAVSIPMQVANKLVGMGSAGCFHATDRLCK